MEHTGPTVGHLKRLVRVWEKILEPRGWCLVRFNLTKSESVGGRRIGGIGYSDWLCASAARTQPANQCGVLERWTSTTRLAPPDVRETYCIARKCRTYTVLYTYTVYLAVVFAVCVMAIFCQTGQTRGNGVVGSDRGSWLLA